MIKRISADQEAQVQATWREWEEGQTLPIDRDVASDAVREVYRRMGWETPEEVFAASPGEVGLVTHSLSQRAQSLRQFLSHPELIVWAGA